MVAAILQTSAKEILVKITRKLTNEIAIESIDGPVKATNKATQLTVNGKKYEGPLAICFYLLQQAKSPLLGKTDLDRTVVYERAAEAVYTWKQQFAQDREQTLLVDLINQKLNAELAGKTFIVSNYFTFGDVALYSTLYNTAIAGDAKDIMHIVRYYEMVQYKLRKLVPSLDLRVDEFDIQVPLVELKQEEKPKKGAEKQAKDGKASKDGSEAKDAKESKKDKPTKSKSDKKDKAGGADKKAPADSKDEKASTLPDPSKLDIRVGYIKSVMKHPDAETLYVEEVDVGEENPRTVVSGLVKHISIEEFTGKHVLLLCNLKPAKMRGIESQAMVLCATSADGNTVELLQPPAGSKPGDVATFEGFQGQLCNVGTPEKQLNSKKKVWEGIQPNLRTNDKKEATFVIPDDSKKACLLKTPSGVCTVKSVTGASIK